MPFDPAVLPVFLAASLLLLVTPGPDMAFIVATGVSEGRRPALWAAAGISLAMFTHAVLAAAGVAAIVATSPQAFDVIRFGGAAYLLFLAGKSFRAKPLVAGTSVTARSPVVNFRRGFMTNLLNPKAILFCGVFLPQFATPSFAPIFPQIVGLGALLALLGLLFQAALSIASGSLGQWLLSSPRRQLFLERLTGLVFLGLAARLLSMERKG
ncbi:MAG: LysE family translocator [Candidatus Accumulibacter sp.]|uniref:LysE family translocator n=1 Tax=Accumulibacter sp. TaxID=2053492 RepID=UPI001AC719F1|nr:LysE family translocator [Accumulibacter sp.]MBN8439590.1 LysE family translocator [Accumulibacter sp.]